MLAVGIDEAGMGTLAGPMVAAVVVIEPEAVPKGVRDSKAIRFPPAREELAAKIMDAAYFYRVLWRTSAEIDTKGISGCWEEVIRQLALDARFMCLPEKPDIILDGGRLVGLPYVRPVVKADVTVPAVSAASILAKYCQCCWMDDLHLQYPQYGFDRHRGYGTVDHMRALEKLGPCPIHRKSYKPIKRLSPTSGS